ncbi:MAG: hypothetical protein L6428_10455 [Candidatus Aminicenantes bacterium]|nr:hypothetical protein [Candidatus Aminicenantes bacterium]
MADDEKTVKLPEKESGHDKEIHGCDFRPMIVQKRQPLLDFFPGRLPPGHIAGDGPFTNAETELEQFAVDARRTPGWIFASQLFDKKTDFSFAINIIRFFES